MSSFAEKKDIALAEMYEYVNQEIKHWFRHEYDSTQDFEEQFVESRAYHMEVASRCETEQHIVDFIESVKEWGKEHNFIVS